MEAEKLLVKMAIEEEREEGKEGEGGKAAGHCKFKWPSQDNSKNAFKRKSVKEFRLWATDCAGRGKPSGGMGDEGRQRLRQRNLSQRQTPNRNSVGARREQRTGQEMENATVDRESETRRESETGERQRERE